MEAVIQTRGLTKYYGKSRGVIGLDLEVGRGEIFGFLGPNGAGKTTTIRMLMGLIHPTGGEASLFGERVGVDNPGIHHRVGYLSGEPGLYPNLKSGVLVKRFASIRRLKDPSKAQRLAGMLELPLDRKTKSFSHGMKQKLAIVLAFMHDADLLVLDEPTSGLDPIAQQQFYALLKEEQEQGRTIFLSSHILTEVERVCHRVGIIREGKLVAVEDIDGLKRKRVKYIEVKFAGEVDIESLRGPGVKSVDREGDLVTIAADGNYWEILKRVSGHPIENINIHDATLEQIFLEYYTEGKGGAA